MIYTVEMEQVQRRFGTCSINAASQEEAEDWASEVDLANITWNPWEMVTSEIWNVYLGEDEE